MISNFNLSYSLKHVSSCFIFSDNNDPINKLINSLNSNLNLKVRLPSDYNLLADEFLPPNQSVLINFKEE